MIVEKRMVQTRQSRRRLLLDLDEDSDESLDPHPARYASIGFYQSHVGICDKYRNIAWWLIYKYNSAGSLLHVHFVWYC